MQIKMAVGRPEASKAHSNLQTSPGENEMMSSRKYVKKTGIEFDLNKGTKATTEMGERCLHAEEELNIFIFSILKKNHYTVMPGILKRNQFYSIGIATLCIPCRISRTAFDAVSTF